MAAFGKSLLASVFLHGAVLVAAAVAVRRAGVETDRDGEPWAESLVAALASEEPDGNSTNDPAPAIPLEAEIGLQPANLPAPPNATIEIPAPQNVITTRAFTPTVIGEPPPPLVKKSGRASSPAPSGIRRGGASRGSEESGGSGFAAYTPARYARCPAPVFPAEARKAKISGTVLLLVEVDENGHPSQVTLRRSSGHATLDDAALRAVRNWRFEPARSEGRPIRARVEVPVRFALS